MLMEGKDTDIKGREEKGKELTGWGMEEKR